MTVKHTNHHYLIYGVSLSGDAKYGLIQAPNPMIAERLGNDKKTKFGAVKVNKVASVTSTFAANLCMYGLVVQL